ncbi:hypothetical protein PM082_024230 [Marasmius tenuissimus]|nr:hypothetical protein PM082_024230 [Marasmius tenuissimus]
MLRALKSTLNLSDPFDACVWAMTACAFWGMMRFGEVSVKAWADFNGKLHLKRADVMFGTDEYTGKSFVTLALPSAKTAKHGEIQKVHLTSREDLCPLEALKNLAKVVPALGSDPLFSWRDRSGGVRPMVKKAALD